MKTLQNEIVAISGGSLGIGFHIAQRLGDAGARISICGRREGILHEAETALRSRGIETLAVRADVSQEADVERWFEETERRFGPVSILVNNAGIAGRGFLMDLDETQWDTTIRVNCRGPFLCTRRAVPAMKKVRRGRILFISSIGGQYYRKEYSLYFASKWALRGFALCLGKELNQDNIHVHVICPGMTETRFFDAYGGRPHPEENQYADPEIVAETAERLCLLPEGIDTNEYSVFPSWQLHNLGNRR